MNKEQYLEQLKLVRKKKEEAVTAQKYEMASQLREREKDILKKIEELKGNNEN